MQVGGSGRQIRENNIELQYRVQDLTCTALIRIKEWCKGPLWLSGPAGPPGRRSRRAGPTWPGIQGGGGAVWTTIPSYPQIS